MRLLVLPLVVLVAGLPAEPALGASVADHGDFNRDGFADLAVGAPSEDVGTLADAGAVNVIYGGPGGLSTARDQLWHQDSAGIAGSAEADDRFGAAVAAGDFNGDGFADLAVGGPSEDVGTSVNAGCVNVIYGRSRGLSAAGDQLWCQDSAGISGEPEAGDGFGFALAAANLDRSTRADLAVGTPAEDVGTIADAGSVNVIYGRSRGLSAAGDQLWHQESAGIAGAAETDDRFGFALVAANFGRSAHADLAVGVPNESAGAVTIAGAVDVLYGRAQGISAAGDQLWNQNSPGVEGAVEAFEHFGGALAAANFGKGPHADLAVGVPIEDVGPLPDAGAVNVLYGRARGLSAAGDQLWHQNRAGVEGGSEAGDTFGFALAAANFGRSPRADLAVGVPTEDVGALGDAGAVDVLYGRPSGLSAARDQLWRQGSAGLGGVAEAGDNFGFALTAADFGRSAGADLAVGTPFESLGAPGAAVVRGRSLAAAPPRRRRTRGRRRPGGLSARGDQLWHQDRAGIADVAEGGDNFGFALAAPGFGKSSQTNLTLGPPGQATGTSGAAGAVNVVYGRGRPLRRRRPALEP